MRVPWRHCIRPLWLPVTNFSLPCCCTGSWGGFFIIADREKARWSTRGPAKTSAGGALFFNHLQSEQPDLLDFKAGAEGNWHIIHGWLLSEGRVSD
jgi:hypothetical protein